MQGILFYLQSIIIGSSLGFLLIAQRIGFDIFRRSIGLLNNFLLLHLSISLSLSNTDNTLSLILGLLHYTVSIGISLVDNILLLLQYLVSAFDFARNCFLEIVDNIQQIIFINHNLIYQRNTSCLGYQIKKLLKKSIKCYISFVAFNHDINPSKIYSNFL